MGLSVGLLLVGRGVITDGSEVGGAVGFPVIIGCSVGRGVGANVGLNVGENEMGFFVGLSDGLELDGNIFVG